MSKLLRTSLAAALLAALFAGSIPAPIEAQVVRPGPIGPARVCTLRLTGQQAWFQATTHQCGGIQIQTDTDRLQMGHPSNPVWVDYYNLRARRLPGFYSFARVEVVNPGGATRVISPPTNGAWTAWETVYGGINAPPPTSVTLTSGFLF
jgi:hypothetical protein